MTQKHRQSIDCVNPQSKQIISIFALFFIAAAGKMQVDS